MKETKPDLPEAILNYVFNSYQQDFNDNRVHVETILSNLGALAGFGCQMAVREGLVKTGKVSEGEAFVVIKAKNGETFYTGDFINEPLLSTDKDQISVWNLVAGMAQHLGARFLPDIDKIIDDATLKMGAASFYVPNLSEDITPKMLPLEALKRYWEDTLILQQEIYEQDSLFLGWNYARAAQTLMEYAKEVIDPGYAVKIFMESAIRMSKINPQLVVPEMSLSVSQTQSPHFTVQ